MSLKRTLASDYEGESSYGNIPHEEETHVRRRLAMPNAR